MANSVDPDQTAPMGAAWSGSALIAQANCLILQDICGNEVIGNVGETEHKENLLKKKKKKRMWYT